jgi:hypothetical protein
VSVSKYSMGWAGSILMVDPYWSCAWGWSGY